MSSQLVKHIRDEIAALNAALAEDPRFVKLRALQGVLDLYEDVQSEAALPAQGNRTANEARTEVVQKVQTFLQNRSEPTPTRVIYAHLQSYGLEIGGKEPVSNLSAMLSNSDIFKSNGRLGWTLKEKRGSQAEEDDDSALDALSFDTPNQPSGERERLKASSDTMRPYSDDIGLNDL